MKFDEMYTKFWDEFGQGKKMVLSTSLNDIVTSRMMSVVYVESALYFQTDRTFRKYEQLRGNDNVALCIDNIQIEGKCREIGHPKECLTFCDAYKKQFPSSYDRYTFLENERLFVVEPTYIQRWIYIEGDPFVERYDVKEEIYDLHRYSGV